MHILIPPQLVNMRLHLLRHERFCLRGLENSGRSTRRDQVLLQPGDLRVTTHRDKVLPPLGGSRVEPREMGGDAAQPKASGHRTLALFLARLLVYKPSAPFLAPFQQSRPIFGNGARLPSDGRQRRLDVPGRVEPPPRQPCVPLDAHACVGDCLGDDWRCTDLSTYVDFD